MLKQIFLSGFSPDLFVNSLNGKSETYVFHNQDPCTQECICSTSCSTSTAMEDSVYTQLWNWGRFLCFSHVQIMLFPRHKMISSTLRNIQVTHAI